MPSMVINSDKILGVVAMYVGIHQSGDTPLTGYYYKQL